jgi:hypothetical protein
MQESNQDFFFFLFLFSLEGVCLIKKKVFLDDLPTSLVKLAF